MANYREGTWRISIVLSVLGLFWGLQWSYREWPKIAHQRQVVSRFEQQVQALALADPRGAEEVPKPPKGFILEFKVVNVPEIGPVAFPGDMTGPQIREAILRLASGEHGTWKPDWQWRLYRYWKPAWYWYASLIAVPLLVSLAPLALYRVVRWVAEGFMHAGN